MLAKHAFAAVAALAAANGGLAALSAGAAAPWDDLATVNAGLAAVHDGLPAGEDGVAAEPADVDLAVAQNLLFFADVAGPSYQEMVVSFVKAICEAAVPDVLDAHRASIYVRPWTHCPHRNYEAIVHEFKELAEQWKEKETGRWNSAQFDVDQPYDVDQPNDLDQPYDVDQPNDVDQPYDLDQPDDVDQPDDLDQPHDLDLEVVPEAVPEVTLFDTEVPAPVVDNTFPSVDAVDVPAVDILAVDFPPVAADATPAVAAQSTPAVSVAETPLDDIVENVSSAANIAQFSAVVVLPAVVCFSAAVSGAALLF